MNKVGLVEHLVHWMSLAYVLLKHCLRAHTQNSHSTPTPVLAKTLQKVEIEQRMQFILPKTKNQKTTKKYEYVLVYQTILNYLIFNS